MARQRMELIFFKGSHGIKDEPEHFGLIAMELMKGSQCADLCKTDLRVIKLFLLLVVKTQLWFLR